jgi:aminoglycoside 6-adenylyltransferase
VTYATLEQNLVLWTRSQPNVRGVIVVGSRARITPPPDAWSDLDIVIFALDPAAYAADAGWIQALGEAWLTVLDHTGAGDPEWYALFAGGLKADFAITRAGSGAADLPALLRASPYRTVYRRGVRALYDAASPDQPPSPLAPPPARALQLPTAGEFDHHVRLTLLLVNRTARLLLRGDLWRAREHYECRLRRQTLTLLEWHAWGLGGASPPDTWHDGRFLEQWADPRALAALPGTLAGSEPESLWRALRATHVLQGWLAREIAERRGLAYPAAAEAQTTAWLDAVQPRGA